MKFWYLVPTICVLVLLLQEVFRIKAEHPDDNQAVFNDRVKGQLKVTRAFGAGFLKKVSCSGKFNISEKSFSWLHGKEQFFESLTPVAYM